MSRHICFRCACGEKDFGASSRFTAVVWDDLLGALGEAGIENPYHPSGEDRTVDGGELLRWWEGTLGTLHGARGRLPTLYQVWHEREGPNGRTAGSDAAYFACRGTVYMVEGVHEELNAVPLPPEVWAERRSRVPYEPPAVEDVAPELVDALSSTDGEVPLYVDEFDRIFSGTPMTLEHGNLADCFVFELREAEDVARHAAGRGEHVVIYTY
jgi:hypothetical protein